MTQSAEGFLSWDLLRQQALDLGPSGFLKAFGSSPFLVLVDLLATDPNDSSPQLTILADSSEDLLDPAPSHSSGATEVAHLAKRPGTPFAAMVTIGRAATCDVILSLGTVSKIHGYFLQTEGRWFLVDQRSMNKTYLNGAPVVAGERTPVVSGDRVKFGSEAEFVFEHADALLPRLLASAA